jgi:autotransporter-associated beta strand protein
MNTSLRPLSILLLSAFTALGAQAASLTWDTDGSTTIATGGAGSWNTSGLNWDNAGSFVAWNNSNGDSAIFGGTAGTVTLGEAITVNNLTFNTASYTIAGGGFGLTVNGTITNSVVATITASIAGSNGLTKSGAGTLTLQAANTYTGATTIQSGILQTRTTGALTAGTTVTVGSATLNATATLDVRASQTVAGIGNAGTGLSTITGDSNTASTRLTINPDGAGVSAADSAFGGTIKDADATHTLGITKAGSRTLTLTGINSFTGTTIVSGGTLKLGSSLTGTASVTVSGGSISGNDVTGDIGLGLGAVSMSSGTISAGGTAAGSFTLAANQNFTTTGGTLTFDIGGTFDQIIGSGTGTFSLTNTTLALSGLTSVAGTYQLFTGFGGTNTVTNLTITGLAGGFTGTLDTSGLLTVSSAIPEPSTFAALAGAAILGFVVVRRRQRNA